MKKIIAMLLLLLATFAFVSCDEESEAAEEGMAQVTVYQENDAYEIDKMLIRIGDVEWDDVEFKKYSPQKNVEPGEYIPEVWSQNDDQTEMQWNEYYYTAEQKTSNRKTFKEDTKYQVRLLNDGSVEVEEMTTR